MRTKNNFHAAPGKPGLFYWKETLEDLYRRKAIRGVNYLTVERNCTEEARMTKRKGFAPLSKGVDKKERVKMGAIKDAREKDRRVKKK